MINHDALVDAAKEAIDALFSDTSVARSKTRDDLKELQGDIKTCLNALDADDARNADE